MKSLLLAILALLIFQGCSSKQYYNPQESSMFEIDKKVVITPSSIETINANGATTKDGRIINNFGISLFKLQDGFQYINNSDNGIISGNKSGDIYLSETNTTINFRTNVIAATLKRTF